MTALVYFFLGINSNSYIHLQFSRMQTQGERYVLCYHMFFFPPENFGYTFRFGCFQYLWPLQHENAMPQTNINKQTLLSVQS